MKQALQDRFADFLRLFAPDTAAALNLSTPASPSATRRRLQIFHKARC